MRFDQTRRWSKAYRGYHPFMPKQKQIIPKPMMHDAILKGHFEIYGSSDQMDPVEDQFKKYIYPSAGQVRSPYAVERYALFYDLLE